MLKPKSYGLICHKRGNSRVVVVVVVFFPKEINENATNS